MSNVLVLAELRGNEPKKITFEMLSAAKEIADATGGSVTAAAIGDDISGMGEQLGPYGAAKVFTKNKVAAYNAEAYTTILAKLLSDEKPDVVLIAASVQGKDLAPRLAARLETGLASDVVGLRMDGDDLIVKRPVFAGKALAEVAFTSAPAIVTVRLNVLDVGAADGSPAEEVAIDAETGTPRTAVVDSLPALSDKPDLTEADRIVSGGRGMKDGENFKILEELADLLGGTVGASRAAVDAGYVDGSYQVGQTGKVVNPSLYVACGIAGAIQHQAGMRTSKSSLRLTKMKRPQYSKFVHMALWPICLMLYPY